MSNDRRERGVGARTYVALLRGVNVGAKNMVSMTDVRALFAALGTEDVATYLQSGNVVFKSPVLDAAELGQTIEDRISRVLGLGVTVLVRTKAQLSKVVATNPFAESGTAPAKLHVTFLADTPRPARVRALDTTYGDPDEFRVVGREVFVHCPSGYGRTKLGTAFFETRLEVAATTRNWNTVTKLVDLVSG